MTELQAEIKNLAKQAKTVELKRRAQQEATTELDDAQQHLNATIERIKQCAR